MDNKEILRSKVRWHQDSVVLLKLIGARISNLMQTVSPLQNDMQYRTETVKRGYIEL